MRWDEAFSGALPGCLIPGGRGSFSLVVVGFWFRDGRDFRSSAPPTIEVYFPAIDGFIALIRWKLEEISTGSIGCSPIHEIKARKEISIGNWCLRSRLSRSLGSSLDEISIGRSCFPWKTMGSWRRVSILVILRWNAGDDARSGERWRCR